MTEFITLGPKAIDITNQHFGRLVALGPIGRKGKFVMWLCQSDCGNTIAVRSSSLRLGRTQSCGCLNKESRTKAKVHGMWNHSLYPIWQQAIQRCTNPESRKFASHGGRGITVCDEWRHDFQAFYDHVSQLPHFGERDYSLDRIDNDGNYEPGNVRWATRKQQQRNRRDNHVVTYQGKTQCLIAWAEEYGVNPATLRNRIYRSGWDVGRALTAPVQGHGSNSDG